MSKYNFGKKGSNKEKDGVEEAKRPDEMVDFTEGTEGAGEDFFDDEYDKVNQSDNLDDLEADIEDIREKTKEKDYRGTAPKKREKIVNVILVGVLTVLVVVGTLFIFREPIRDFIGTGSNVTGDYDIKGGVEEYKEDVTSELKKEDIEEEVEEEFESSQVEELEVIEEGTYIVGKDVKEGLYVADNVLVERFTSVQEFNDKKNPNYSNVNRVKEKSLVQLDKGQVVRVEKGKLILNKSREKVKVNIGDNFKLSKGDQLIVGVDFPEGFYKAYNLNLLERKENTRDVSIKVIRGDKDKAYQVKRKTVMFFPKDTILESKGDIILERIASDGSGGNQEELLDELSENKEVIENKDLKEE